MRARGLLRRSARKPFTFHDKSLFVFEGADEAHIVGGTNEDWCGTAGIERGAQKALLGVAIVRRNEVVPNDDEDMCLRSSHDVKWIICSMLIGAVYLYEGTLFRMKIAKKYK